MHKYINLDSLIANLREHFAEFLKNFYSITLEYASYPLVLVLVQFFLYLSYFLIYN